MTPAEVLNAALIELTDTGRCTPCQGTTADWWTSDDWDERDAAAHHCQACPVLALCTAAADEAREAWHVYGGTDRTRRQPSPRRAAV
jgi:hypothetical protein